MKKIKVAVVSLTAVMMGVFALTPVAPVYADVAGEIQGGVNAIGGDEEKATLGGRLEDVVNILLFVLGAIAVIMIVIGGIRYATSNGESSQISSAKNTILYAVIGLIVAVLAYSIVNFVLGSF